MADRIGLSNHRRKLRLTLLPESNIISGLLFISLLAYCASIQLKICANCEQGNCDNVNGQCVCYQGWEGDSCNKCKGKVSIPSTKDGRFSQQGIIYDGSGNYSQESTCSWLLKADKEKNARVQLIFNEFATECIWDHLYIHDGDSAFSPLVAAFSGVFGSLKHKPRLKFNLTGQYAFIHFYSDAAFILPGFNISYIIDNCSLECSEQGRCENSTCICDPDWTGVNCDTPVCPLNCSNNGICRNNSCLCKPGFTGNNCENSNSGLNIELMAPQLSGKLTGRASMSLVFDDSDSLWMLGGYRMRDYTEMNNLFSFNISSKDWDASNEFYPANESSKEVWPRYGHSAVFYNKSLYLYGGTHKYDIVQDFWEFNTITKLWKRLAPGIRDVTGHTAHIYQDTMIVIFGYSSNFGYLNEVAEYSFISRQWRIVSTKGCLVQGSYAHTSVYDEHTQKIYVYGGYQAHLNKGGALSDKVYRYDPKIQEWFKLQSSGTPRYMHSAAIINGMMLTFGGSFGSNTINETSMTCFVSDFMVYDIECDKWSTVNVPDHYFQSPDRFGHSMVAINNTAYVFGGFNSLVLNDLFKITLDNCDFYQNETLCESPGNGIKCQWLNNNTCIKDTRCKAFSDGNSLCSGYTNCNSCQSASGAMCQWCGNQCLSLAASNKCSQNASNCTDDEKEICSSYFTCKACQENSRCSWQSTSCVLASKNKSNETKTCPKSCSEHTGCLNCTNAYCMWCGNLEKCIETNAYVVTYHFAQCTDWTTKINECQAMNCSQHKTCSECQDKPQCGWCNDETETGTGKCMEGSYTGPKIKTSCPAERWSFLQCPLCQCNGHSKCDNDTHVCTQCENYTTGTHCSECTSGYYGDPKNGGQCSPCVCNGHADNCNPSTGDCFCRIRGITGKNCDKCDDNNKYSGNPKDGGTCYYPLNTDFQYTFNLSKKEDINYTQINFLNTPLSSDRDVDFTLNCSSNALINITYKSKSFPEEKEYTIVKPCEYFRTKFEHKNHAFGGKENTTFYVYVYGFKTPFMLMISFVQPEKINLLRFFIIFFSCFLSLLLIAAALWKIKHKYDSYRRRQQLIVEMQQMASRPFSAIAVEIERKSCQTITVDKKDHLDSVLRRRKKTMNKPSAIAIEPLADHKAAILTLFIQLPTGDGEFAPSGQSGLAVGSAFVSIGSHRKQSLEHAKGDKPKIRKNLAYNHPDTCA